MTDEPKYTNILMSGRNPSLVNQGLKTQTRRTGGLGEVNQSPGGWAFSCLIQREGKLYARFLRGKESRDMEFPYGDVGSRLRVREAVWQWGWWQDTGELTKTGKPKKFFIPATNDVRYVSDQPEAPVPLWTDGDEHWVKRPAMFMPAWACRSVLEIVSVRVERLQEMKHTDAIAEGAVDWYSHYFKIHGLEAGRAMVKHAANRNIPYLVSYFAELWDEIHGPGSWYANPWVWRIEFRKVEA